MDITHMRRRRPHAIGITRLRFVRVLGLASLLAVLPALQAQPLAGSWHFDGGAGQVLHDTSGNGLDGVLGSTAGPDDNDPTWVTQGCPSQALYWDGTTAAETSDYVRILNDPRLEPATFTANFCVRNNGFPGAFRYLLSKGALTCQYASYAFFTAGSGGLSFYVVLNGRGYLSPAAPASIWNGEWHHIAGSFDGSKVRLSLDGIEVGDGTSVPAGSTITYGLPDGNDLIIGNYLGSCRLPWKGELDKIELWGRSLSPEEILVISSPTLPPIATAQVTPNPACPAQAVTFDGSASADQDAKPGGRTMTWEWDFDITVDSDLDGVPDDDVDATGVVVAEAFPPGIRTVQLTFTDDDDESDTAQVVVIIEDTQAPRIQCPPNFEVACDPGACGAQVSFQPAVDDDCSTVQPECVPASGSFFPIGIARVSCTATDLAGNWDICSFSVSVTDIDPPTIDCPTDPIVREDGSSVTFFVGSRDNCGLAPVVCTALSGSVFAVGTTIVSCTATDASGNASTCEFYVQVLPPPPYSGSDRGSGSARSAPPSPHAGSGSRGR